ncbi:MAG: hypothetical protein HY901_14830 [Deltaproteobacteria bacterium]|nr:hypothetical protein [Deltaproteobacteria bacterium]
MEVDAISGFLATSNTLLITNFTDSLLLTGVATASGPPGKLVSSVGYLPIGPGLDGKSLSIHAGLAVMPARVLHYYVCPSGDEKEMTLYRSWPTVCGSVTGPDAPVFCDEYNSNGGIGGKVVARHITNFHVEYGVDEGGAFGNVSNIKWVPKLDPSASTAVQDARALRQLRIELVSITGQTALSASGAALHDKRPVRKYRAVVGIRNGMLNSSY